MKNPGNLKLSKPTDCVPSMKLEIDKQQNYLQEMIWMLMSHRE